MKNKTDAIEDWCQHYAGMSGVEGFNLSVDWKDSHCRAGVRHGAVAVDVPGAKNNLDRMPCFKRNGLTCPKQRFNTPVEIVRKRQAQRAAIKAWVDKLNHDVCPQCDTPVAKHRQVGRCVYAEPCGHRLFQGRAKDVTDEEYEAAEMDVF